MNPRSPALQRLGVTCFWIGVVVAVYLLAFVGLGLAFHKPWAAKSAFLSIPSGVTALGLGCWIRYRLGWRV